MDLSGSSETSMTDATILDAPRGDTAAREAAADSQGARPLPYPVEVDHSRDALLTDFGKDTLDDRYLLPGESYQDLFVRVASAYADDQAHAQRLYDYISKLWFMPATPVLSNGGTGRGLPISCFLHSGSHSLNGIVDTLNEKVWVGSGGGGGGARRRDRHLLGQRPRDRRAGRAQRQDQRDHPVRARDGLADAGDQPRL